MKDIKLKDGDIDVTNGKIQLVEKTDKLKQQLGKILLTNIGNYLHENYGSRISEMLGKPYIGNIEAQIKSEIRNALNYFIDLQQKGILFNMYEMEEILYKVAYINVNLLSGDKRGVVVDIGVIDGTLQNVSIEQIFLV